jgi:hypothetical protein
MKSYLALLLSSTILMFSCSSPSFNDCFVLTDNPDKCHEKSGCTLTSIRWAIFEENACVGAQHQEVCLAIEDKDSGADHYVTCFDRTDSSGYRMFNASFDYYTGWSQIDCPICQREPEFCDPISTQEECESAYCNWYTDVEHAIIDPETQQCTGFEPQTGRCFATSTTIYEAVSQGFYTYYQGSEGIRTNAETILGWTRCSSTDTTTNFCNCTD